jgi:probable F420-dependent oxidoreductase
MRLTYSLPLGDWGKASSEAKRAEGMDYDVLMTSEIQHDPFVPLAFAALATERVELTTAIAVAFPRSPMVVANVAWDLQLHSRGRFVLGLGSQVRGHNVRRFSVPWSAPVPRLREYVQALRAIWRCWELREPLKFEGEHYRFTLMTPEFAPEPTGLPPIPVAISAVGPAMLKMAGRVCDGVRLHGFCTRRYVEEVALPRVLEGLEQAGRDRASFDVWGGGFAATAPDAAGLARQLDWVRYRVAFYGSTPAYADVLRLHGWDALHEELHEMSRTGRWKEMASRVPDEVVHTFAAVAPYDGIVDAVRERFGGLVDGTGVMFPPDAPAGLQREINQEIRAIPSPFRGFPKTW